MRIPAPRTGQPALTLFPDGIEHPRFRGRKSGRAHYVICRKDAVEEIPERKSAPCQHFAFCVGLTILMQKSPESMYPEDCPTEISLNK